MLNSDKIKHLGRKISDTTVAMHQALAKNAGLTGTDHKYLGVIINKGKLTAGELSALTGLTTGAATGLIDRLEKKKLVKREFDKSDRRKVYIVANTTLTDKLFKKTNAELQKQIENLISEFTGKEQEIIERYLTATIEIMENITTKLIHK